jgi:4-amino-4-deoxy-L-arabinose transferase-like glycosyltransferase
MSKSKNFLLLLFFLVLILIIPNLIQQGMFVDGLWYAAIAHNEANGLGSFWAPMFTKTMFPVFHEHPPLVFGLQAIFFKLFGDGFYTEKIYAFVIILITLLLINSLWKHLFPKDDEFRKMGYIACLIWLLCETVYIYYPNNLLECTQTVFILSAVILILKGLKPNSNFSYILFTVSSIFLVLSFLSKGLAGLFPLITIPLYYLSVRTISFRKALLFSLFILGVFGIVVFVLIQNSWAHENIGEYLKTQVYAALNGKRTENIQQSRFYIIQRLFETNLLPIVLVFVTTFISYNKKWIGNPFLFKKEIVFLVLLTASAVLPIMISKKQATYYLIPALPFFSMALGLFFIGNKRVLEFLNQSKKFTIILCVLIIGAVLLNVKQIGSTNKRDKVALGDATKVLTEIDKGSIIGCETKKKELTVYGYMMREKEVSLDTTNPFNYSVLLTDSDSLGLAHGYQKLDLGTTKFHLYKRKSLLNEEIK